MNPKTSLAPQRRRKRPIAVTVAALIVGGVVAVAVVGGIVSPRENGPQPKAASPERTDPPTQQRGAARPLVLDFGGPAPGAAAIPVAPPTAPKVHEEPTPPVGRKFVRYEVPSDKVRVNEIGEGFEVITTDPSLAGKQIEIKGVTETGERVSYTVSVPNAVPSAQ
jgi:hypothetical protein